MSESEYSAHFIKVLTQPEHVRRRPGMYFGDMTTGLTRWAFELVSNGLDQFLLGKATRIEVSLSGDGLTVADDGPGLPFDKSNADGTSWATLYLTQLHNSATADAHAPHVHLQGAAGVGLAAVNAVASSLTCTTWRNGLQWRQEFRKARPLAPPEQVEDCNGRGTLIEAVPDPGIWDTSLRDIEGSLRSGLLVAAHLVPGIRIRFQEEQFFAPKGLAALVQLLEPQGFTRESWPLAPFSFRKRIDDVDLNIAMIGRAKTTQWRTWVNGVPSLDRGSDRIGLENVLKKVGWTPAVVASHLVMHDPRFAGPTRDCLEVASIIPLIQSALDEPMSEYLQTFPSLSLLERP